MANQITPNPSVPSQVVAEVKFPKFINNLGIIPTSYKDSMSYYECLAWLCKFLEETVIPTVNENGEAVEELQNLYVQLREYLLEAEESFETSVNNKVQELEDYMNDYFDNLDVQEEINNKLDDMVEAGTLQEIIADYLNSKAIFGFDNVASMKSSTNLINGSYAETLGYYNKGDFGKALYKIRKITNDDVIDNMTVIEMDDSENELIAELIIPSEITPEILGAKGDGTTDDTLQIKKAIEIGKNKNITVKLLSTYLISDSIVIDYDNFNIIGQNNATLLQNNSTKDILLFDRPYHQTMHNCVLDNINLSYVTYGETNTAGMKFIQTSQTTDKYGIYHSVFTNIRIRNAYYGIYNENDEPLWNDSFTNISIEKVVYQAFYIGTGSFGNVLDISVIGTSANPSINRIIACKYQGGGILKLDIEDWTGPVLSCDGSFYPIKITSIHLERCTVVTNYGSFINFGSTPIIIDEILMYNCTSEVQAWCSLIQYYSSDSSNDSHSCIINTLKCSSLNKTESTSRISCISPSGNGAGIISLMSQYGFNNAYYPYAAAAAQVNCYYKYQLQYQ